MSARAGGSELVEVAYSAAGAASAAPCVLIRSAALRRTVSSGRSAGRRERVGRGEGGRSTVFISLTGIRDGDHSGLPDSLADGV